jgi:hypothetical protein
MLHARLIFAACGNWIGRSENIAEGSIFSGAGVSPACRRIAGTTYRPKDDCRLAPARRARRPPH